MNPLRFLYGFICIIFLITCVSVSVAQEDSLKAIVILEDGYNKTDLYLHISQKFKSTNIDSAIYYAEQARIAAMRNDDDRGIAEALFTLGKIDLRQDSSTLARENFYRALDYTTKCDCKSLEASILLFLGRGYLYQDNYGEAISNYMKSLSIAEEMNDITILSELYDDIGLVMLFLEDFDQAKAYFGKALAINKNSGDIKQHANTLRNIGFIHQSQKHYLEAEEHFIEALYLYTEIGHYPGMSTSTIGIGNTEFEMENYQTALKFYLEAIEIAKKIDIKFKSSGPFIQALAYNRLGETYLELGRYSKAIGALRSSSDLSEEFGLPGRKADASLFFSRVYERMGNTILAFEYFKSYNELSDSIINAKNVSAITKLEMEYQFLKKQKERELEQLRKDAANKRKVLIYELMIGVAGIMLVLLIIILFLYRKNEKSKIRHAELREQNLELEKDNLQKELDYKNKELTTSVMYQLKKNNFIWSISEKLKEVTFNLKPENKKNIKDIIKEMDSNMTKESWEEFEFRFNEVHNNFYDNLTKAFPDLTPNELKLSAFLKLNMTTKDIATITYQSTHSITVARHRLRTKLDLDRDDNLVTFLSGY